MAHWLRRWWRVLKILLTLAILAGVGWQFVRILQAPELQATDAARTPAEILWDHVRQARPGWLLASGVIYLLGLAFPALYWARLQRHLGQPLPGAVAVARAYYISHLGKYLPGKAWALVLRATLIAGPPAKPRVVARSPDRATSSTEGFQVTAGGGRPTVRPMAGSGDPATARVSPVAGSGDLATARGEDSGVRGVRGGIAGMAAFYEVLTTMTGGALFAAVLFLLLMPDRGTTPDWSTIKALFTLRLGDSSVLDRRLLALAAALVALPVGLPLLPPLFNRLAHRTSSPFRQADAAPLPQVRWLYLAEGLGLSCCTWLLLGASMLAVFWAVLPQPPAWSFALWGRHTALFALGYVSSFLIFVVPGSFGVREYSLTLFLVPEIVTMTEMGGAEARVIVVVCVLILRLVWTLAELLISGLLYWSR